MSEASLTSDVRKLWDDLSTHKFLTQFSHLVETYPLKDIIVEASSYMASCCYEPSYRATVPHSLMGLFTAWELGDFCNSQDRLLPIAQMLWYGVVEARSPKIDVKKLISSPPAGEELNVETFGNFYQKRNFEEAFRFLIFLLKDPASRKKVLTYLFREALVDEVHLGHKLIYLSKTWKFSERMRWKNDLFIWFPVLHYFMKSISHIATFSTVEVFYQRHWKELLKALAQEEGELTGKFYEDLKSSLYDDEKEITLEKILKWISQGKSFGVIFEALSLAANELVLTSAFKKWATSIHAFHFTQAAWMLFPNVEPQDRIKGLLMSALMVKNMVILSKPLAAFSPLPVKTLEQKENALFYVEFWIQKGDAKKALGALASLTEQNGITHQALETLGFLASKNLYSVLYAHDIKFAYASLRSYKAASHSLKNVYLNSLVKLLAEEPKEFTIYYGVANTQKIKLGYYAASGAYNF